MYRRHHWVADETEAETAKRQTGALVGLVVVLMLLIGGLFLVQQLRRASMIQDCVMAGRSNCDPIVNDGE